ncbi:hypothetical protein AAG565_03135 [Fontimonas sp. SYSU GA230001]|uniref:hypothetical protein n=1 Tax=Fontimonas sp. SYSU GA230001 TaxID=3142450 RepID=UPI0032B478F4
MQQPSRRSLSLAVLGLVGFGLFNYPLLSVVDGASGPLGAPALLIYLFAVWAALIGLTLWLRR